MNIYPVRNKTQPLFWGADCRDEQFMQELKYPVEISNGIYSHSYLVRININHIYSEEAF